MGYRGEIDKQNRARDLRAQGWTLSEICEEVGCSKASASLWCREVELDQEVLARRRRVRFLAGNEGARLRGPNKLQRRKQAEIEEMSAKGVETVGRLSPRDLMVVGVALYAGEGSKTPGEVRFANSDPRMIRCLVELMRGCFGVEPQQMKLRLYLHEGLDLVAANRFWSEVTGIPAENVRKPYRAVPDPSIRRAKHPMGCPAVCVTSMRLHREVMGLVSALLSLPGLEAGCFGIPSPNEIDPG